MPPDTIGKIVSSNSHIEYICQVHAVGEAENVPEPSDHGFGTFVRIQGPQGVDLVGIIYDTSLRNPEFGNLGPRLSGAEDLAIFSPDYLAEKVTLVAIVVLGQMDASGLAGQQVPALAAQIDAYVSCMDDGALRAFHGTDGQLQAAYLPRLASMSHPLAPYLMQAIIDRLIALYADHASRLTVLRGNLAWKSRVEPIG